MGEHNFREWESLYELARWGWRIIHLLPFLLLISVYCHNYCRSEEGKTNGLEQALPSVTYYLLFCHSGGLARSLYTATVDSQFSHTPIRSREPETCCTHCVNHGTATGPKDAPDALCLETPHKSGAGRGPWHTTCSGKVILARAP